MVRVEAGQVLVRIRRCEFRSWHVELIKAYN